MRAFVSWGVARRLARLRSPGGAYLWLALDHGLTFGHRSSPTNITETLAHGVSGGFSGAVLNRGSVQKLPADSPLGLVLQCSGLPSHRDSIVAKTAIATVADAVGLGADAVAVELNMNAPSLLDGVTRVAQTITDATSRSMPVLVMVTPSASDDTVDAFADALRIASELGADLIKVGMPTELLKMSDAELGDMRMLLAAAPPTLLAGGPTNATLLTTAKRAREAGFAGVCIGRNIFESPDAPGLCCDLSAVFADASGPPPC